MKNVEPQLRLITARQLAQDLLNRGFIVVTEQQWERPIDVQRRFKIRRSSTFHTVLERYRERFGKYPTIKGATGRIVFMAVTPNLARFISNGREQ